MALESRKDGQISCRYGSLVYGGCGVYSRLWTFGVVGWALKGYGGAGQDKTYAPRTSFDHQQSFMCSESLFSNIRGKLKRRNIPTFRVDGNDLDGLASQVVPGHGQVFSWMLTDVYALYTQDLNLANQGFSQNGSLYWGWVHVFLRSTTG